MEAPMILQSGEAFLRQNAMLSAAAEELSGINMFGCIMVNLKPFPHD
jgi:hypothetical protein